MLYAGLYDRFGRVSLRNIHYITDTAARCSLLQICLYPELNYRWIDIIHLGYYLSQSSWGRNLAEIDKTMLTFRRHFINRYYLNVPVHNFEILLRNHWDIPQGVRLLEWLETACRCCSGNEDCYVFIKVYQYSAHAAPTIAPPAPTRPQHPKLTEPRHFYESMIWILFCCRRPYCSPALYNTTPIIIL